MLKFIERTQSKCGNNLNVAEIKKDNLKIVKATYF